jgi:hypothetical protein
MTTKKHEPERVESRLLPYQDGVEWAAIGHVYGNALIGRGISSAGTPEASEAAKEDAIEAWHDAVKLVRIPELEAAGVPEEHIGALAKDIGALVFTLRDLVAVHRSVAAMLTDTDHDPATRYESAVSFLRQEHIGWMLDRADELVGDDR